jgi:hypothetical protein
MFMLKRLIFIILILASCKTTQDGLLRPERKNPDYGRLNTDTKISKNNAGSEDKAPQDGEVKTWEQKSAELAEVIPPAEENNSPLFKEPEFENAEPEFRETPASQAEARVPTATDGAVTDGAVKDGTVTDANATAAGAQPAVSDKVPDTALAASESSAPRPPPAPPKTVKPAERPPRPVPAPKPPVERAGEKPAADAPLFSETPPVRTAALPARAVPAETAPQKKRVSRTVRALVGQMLEIPFRGSGWVYLGEQDAKRGAAYDSRRLDNEGQTFVFRVEAPGEYRLEFSRQDFINNAFLEDVVELIAVEAPPHQTPRLPGEKDRIVAEPRWPASGAELRTAKLQDTEPKPNENGGVLGAAPLGEGGSPYVQDADSALEHTGEGGDFPPSESKKAPSSRPDYMVNARAVFKEGKFSEAISALDRLREADGDISDEAWWLYGQSFESNSNARDIKSAADAYNHIIRDFPQSEYYNNARSRLNYINRFYFNIR